MNTGIFDDSTLKLRFEFDPNTSKASVTSAHTGNFVEKDADSIMDAFDFFAEARRTRNDWDTAEKDCPLF